MKFVFVVFVNDKVKHACVASDVKDFHPKHSSDFDKKKAYEVLFPHVPNEGSFSTEGYYPANILFMSGDIQSFKLKAKTHNVKLSSSFVKRYEAKGDVSSKQHKPKTSTKKSTVKKDEASESSKKKRVEKILSSNLTTDHLFKKGSAAGHSSSSKPTLRHHSKAAVPVKDSDSSTSGESDPMATDDDEKTFFEDQVKVLQKDLKAARTEIASLRSLNSRLQEQLLTKLESCAPSDSPERVSDPFEILNYSSTFKTPDKSGTKLVHSSPSKAVWNMTPKQIHLGDLDGVTDAATTPPTEEAVKTPESNGKPSNSFSKSFEFQEASPSISQALKKPKKAEQLKGSPMILSNSSLAPMLLKAMKNEVPLQEDGLGKVHVGNGIYVKKSNFTERYSSTAVEHNTAVAEIAEEMWQTKGLSERSLSGGKNPRFPNNPAKLEATPAKMEVCYALARARLAREGITDERVVSSYLKDSVKKSLKSKFNEADRFMKKAAKKSLQSSPAAE